jgi:hypothetical protein
MTTAVDAAVSVFQGARDTRVVETVPLGAVLERIRIGTYRDTVLAARRLKQQESAYRSAKERLLAFTPGCALHTRDKDVPWSKKLISTTGIVHYDFDHLRDPAALKQQLARSKALVFAFISPSGDGLKVGIAATGITDTESYRHVWAAVLRRLKKRYPDLHITEDEHVKFLHALCFVSDDPDLYINAEAVPLDVEPQPQPDALDDDSPPDTAGEGIVDSATVASALFTIPDYDTYDTWLRVGMALHSTRQPWARELWNAWSAQSAKYEPKAQRAKWESFTHEREHQVHIGALLTIAHQHGWRRPVTVNGTTAHAHAPAVDALPPARQAVSFVHALLSFEELLTLNIPERKRYVDWLPERGLVMGYGPRGAGKTMFMLGLTVGLTTGKPFLKWPINHQAGVLYVDGEMPLVELRERTVALAQAIPQQLYFLTGEVVYQKLSVDLTLTSKEARTAIEHILDANPSIRVVILDNISCLFVGISEDKKQDWEPIGAWLVRLRHRGITVVLVHHAGKGGQQRGTSGREDALDAVLSLEYPQGYRPEDGCHFILRFQKSRSVKGEAVSALDVRLEEKKGVPTWTYRPFEESARERVEQMLNDGMSPAEIATELGVTRSCAYRIKRDMAKTQETQQ